MHAACLLEIGAVRFTFSLYQVFNIMRAGVRVQKRCPSREGLNVSILEVRIDFFKEE